MRVDAERSKLTKESADGKQKWAELSQPRAKQAVQTAR